jgi:glycine C-acetyltransferase
MLGDARLAQAMAARPLRAGRLCRGLLLPGRAEGPARIRTQMNAALTRADLDFALDAFEQAGRDTGVLA